MCNARFCDDPCSKNKRRGIGMRGAAGTGAERRAVIRITVLVMGMLLHQTCMGFFRLHNG